MSLEADGSDLNLLLEEANMKHRPLCMWFMSPDAILNPENAEEVMKALRSSGKEGMLLAARISHALEEKNAFIR